MGRTSGARSCGRPGKCPPGASDGGSSTGSIRQPWRYLSGHRGCAAEQQCPYPRVWLVAQASPAEDTRPCDRTQEAGRLHLFGRNIRGAREQSRLSSSTQWRAPLCPPQTPVPADVTGGMFVDILKASWAPMRKGPLPGQTSKKKGFARCPEHKTGLPVHPFHASPDSSGSGHRAVISARRGVGCNPGPGARALQALAPEISSFGPAPRRPHGTLGPGFGDSKVNSQYPQATEPVYRGFHHARRCAPLPRQLERGRVHQASMLQCHGEWVGDGAPPGDLGSRGLARRLLTTGSAQDVRSRHPMGTSPSTPDLFQMRWCCMSAVTARSLRQLAECQSRGRVRSRWSSGTGPAVRLGQ